MTDADLPLRTGGYLGTEQGVERLLSDLRVMSGAGIERAAWGWDRHVGEAGLEQYREAERAAVHELEAAGRGDEWETLRRQILDLTEGHGSLVAWRAEHGPAGHGAEQAALGAGLGLLAGGGLGRDDLIVLLHPMDEALPWLLPEVPAEPAS
jgi:hypothetical protein